MTSLAGRSSVVFESVSQSQREIVEQDVINMWMTLLHSFRGRSVSTLPRGLSWKKPDLAVKYERGDFRRLRTLSMPSRCSAFLNAAFSVFFSLRFRKFNSMQDFTSHSQLSRACVELLFVTNHLQSNEQKTRNCSYCLSLHVGFKVTGHKGLKQVCSHSASSAQLSTERTTVP